MWTPTPDCAEQIDKQIDIPVIGLGIDSGINPEIFNLNIHKYDYELDKDTFKFIIACDGALVTPGRPNGGCRGTDIAIAAYVRYFSSDDNVCLIVKAGNNHGIINHFIDSISLLKNNAPLIIKDFKHDPQPIVAGKWKAADYMLSPIRDCRWEACCLEALACGTRILATNCGGPRMYGKYGVEFVEPVKADGDFFISMGDRPIASNYWTEPLIPDFGTKMRQVFEKRKLNDTKASEYVLEHWTWEKIAEKIVHFFKALPNIWK
jgi:glycosyltransferase involved in cell wall biosynthesis